MLGGYFCLLATAATDSISTSDFNQKYTVGRWMFGHLRYTNIFQYVDI